MPSRRFAASLSQVSAILLAVLIISLCSMAPGLHAGDDAERNAIHERARLRHPVALVVDDEAHRAFVANRKSGSVSVVDLAVGRVLAEFDVAGQLADMAEVPGGRYLVAVDDGADELLLLARDGDTLSVAGRLSIPGAPVTVAVAPDGSLCTVASLWAHRLTVVDLTALRGGADLPTADWDVQQIDLPFAPRQQVFTADGSRLIVAGSFRAQLAIVDVARRELIGDRALKGHNVRGMSLSHNGRELLLAYQILDADLGTTRENVLWADLMRNVVRRVPLDGLIADDGPRVSGYPHRLGIDGNAGGDPAGVVESPQGTLCVALAGVGEIALQSGEFHAVKRVPVGRRPTAVTLLRDGRDALVANTYDDSLSLVDLESAKVTAEISLGPPGPLSLVDRGEMLFHDAGLSLHGWYSCHSCHSEGHANGMLNDNKSDGSYGAPKRVLSLLGVHDTAPLAWRANVERLEDQIHRSIQSTMIGEGPADNDVDALAAFLRSLTPPPPLGDFREPANEEAIARGQIVFREKHCDDCHTPPTFTSADTYDVGLSDAVGNNKFNPPSLRGVSQREPLFHDGSAETLEDVFRRHGHPRRLELSERDLADLLAYLRSL